ncbi:MAG TPA: KaiC domain-containing protein [Methanomassiliicoccales archaeon]|jgi:KaiC domain protein|nr:KaiC domain-containing protein [Methanomassiliicoccales archaeon]
MGMEKVRTGIEGLDEMLFGGIPIGSTVVVMGSFGTGKTTFGLQFLNQGLAEGEKGIYISLEEDKESILADAEAHGWDLRSKMNEKQMEIVKLEPNDAKVTIQRIKSELPDFIKKFGASRIVIDSVSLLNLLFDTDHDRRTNLFNLSQMVKKTGATLLMTAEVKDDNPFASRDGLIEYVADGVISLRYLEMQSRNELMLSLRIIKMRRTEHSRKITPYSITNKGLEVHVGSEF